MKKMRQPGELFETDESIYDFFRTFDRDAQNQTYHAMSIPRRDVPFMFIACSVPYLHQITSCKFVSLIITPDYVGWAN